LLYIAIVLQLSVLLLGFVEQRPEVSGLGAIVAVSVVITLGLASFVGLHALEPTGRFSRTSGSYSWLLAGIPLVALEAAAFLAIRRRPTFFTTWMPRTLLLSRGLGRIWLILILLALVPDAPSPLKSTLYVLGLVSAAVFLAGSRRNELGPETSQVASFESHSSSIERVKRGWRPTRRQRSFPIRWPGQATVALARPHRFGQADR
jgi:hypothetical protein